MKQLTLLFTALFLFVVNVAAQNTTTWFPSGTKWVYTYASLSGGGEEYLDLVDQELVGGELCAKLHYHGYETGWATGPFDLGFRYFFARNDSVFLWGGSAFKLLYDFNRMEGDTFSIPAGIYDHGLVVHTGDTTWNGIPLRFQDLKLTQYPFSPGSDTLTLNTRVYERLGGTHLIYWDDESPLTEIQYELGCYRDDEYPQLDCQLGYDPTYIGFPKFSKLVWSETDGSWCNYRGYQYKLEGDSVIWGVGQGQKVYFRNTYIGTNDCPDGSVEIIHEPFRLIGLLDQSVQYKKVYFTRFTSDAAPFPVCVENDSLQLNTYTLLYDFDLKVGDTVHWKPKPNLVQAIDSIQMDNGTWRRTFVFDTNDPYYWIEGLGSNLGLFGSFANTQITDQFCRLQCFRYDNTLIYSTVEATFCDSVTVAAYEPKDFDRSLRLYPNPSPGATTLEIPVSEVPALLRIFDVQGRELGRLEVSESQHRLDLSTYQKHGVLMLQIRSASGQTAIRILCME